MKFRGYVCMQSWKYVKDLFCEINNDTKYDAFWLISLISMNISMFRCYVAS